MREERAAVAGRMLALAIALALAKAMVDTMRELDQRLRGRRASNPYDSKRTHGQGALWWLRGPH